MNPRVKEAVLWGVVGCLTFLVLLQGYELLEDVRVDLGVKFGAGLVVLGASAVLTYVGSGYVGPNGSANDAPIDQSLDDGGDATPSAGEPVSDDAPEPGDASESDDPSKSDHSPPSDDRPENETS